MTDLEYMKLAVEEAREGIIQGHGGPFGSVIVKDGQIVGRGHNRVIRNNDPTCHGEMEAIRDACSHLGTFDLTGCTIYTTGEPCHMCLCALMWANIDKIYYGCSIAENGRIGFRDDKFDGIFGGRDRLGDLMTQVGQEECAALFDEYMHTQHQEY